ncbi:MAG: 50S ribosomal protein L11 methyltransferase [Acidobacteria bacterium]|nr:MAG: 50S ribosomal protein L11 methyltransferase [Acidobacteriota bacterium]
MSWNQITLDVPDDLQDAIVGELFDDGVAGVWETHAPAPGMTRLVLFFDPQSDQQKIESQIRTVFERSRRRNPVISRSVVEECDWTEEWKKSYTSFPIGEDFFVVPSWEECNCPHDRLSIRIDPGQAFGTGTHETTQLTIEALERWVEENHIVLDLGTGSGILAIASRLLGAKEVYACDIDPDAVHVARANIERNAENRVWTFSGSVDAVKSHSVRLLLCNLTADLIISLFSELDRVLQPHGIAILSGVLHEQGEQLRDVITQFGFIIHEELTRGEWLAVIAEKHAA